MRLNFKTKRQAQLARKILKFIANRRQSSGACYKFLAIFMVLLVTLPQNAGKRRKNLKERKFKRARLRYAVFPPPFGEAARKRPISTLTGKAEAKMMRSFWLPSFASKAGR